MTNRKDGGAAFPCAAFGPSDDAIFQEGLSLRDWFAGMSLAGIFNVGEDLKTALGRTVNENDMAVLAYSLADAMLTEREKAGGE